MFRLVQGAAAGMMLPLLMTMLVQAARGLVTGVVRLVLTGGGNRSTLTGRPEGGDESVRVGKAQR